VLEAHRDEIQRLTGLVLSPHYGASKLRWCLDELHEVQQAQREHRLHCGPLAGYLLQGLLGTAAANANRLHMIDPANASRTQLWSPHTRDWSPLLLEWFGIPREVLPQSVSTTHRYGSLLVGNQSVPFTVCTGDQAAVPFAQGELDNATLYLNLGTGAFALAPLTDDIEDVAPLLRSVLWSDEHTVRYVLEGTVNGAASALQWLAERNGLDVQRAALALSHSHVAHLSVPLFINAVGGIGSPYWMANVESHFVQSDGAQMNDDQAQVAAVVESIAFLVAANVNEMQQRAPQLEQIVIGGGLAACTYLCESIAALTQLPLTRLSESELTAKGLAFLIAGQPAQWMTDANSTEFKPVTLQALHSRYQKWSQHMAKLNAANVSR